MLHVEKSYAYIIDPKPSPPQALVFTCEAF
jgi:hypothetical protein